MISDNNSVKAISITNSKIQINSLRFTSLISQLQVDLRAGESLVVPKHWWHYVENHVPSISINTWIELVSFCNHFKATFNISNILAGAFKSESCYIRGGGLGKAFAFQTFRETSGEVLKESCD